MKIQFFIRYVYGKPTKYLTGDAAGAVHELTRRRTVEQSDLDALAELGHEIVQVIDPSTVAAPHGRCQHKMCRLASTCTVILHGRSARLCAEHGRIADMGNWEHVEFLDFQKTV
jgi:hypothetical protein